MSAARAGALAGASLEGGPEVPLLGLRIAQRSLQRRRLEKPGHTIRNGDGVALEKGRYPVCIPFAAQALGAALEGRERWGRAPLAELGVQRLGLVGLPNLM